MIKIGFKNFLYGLVEKKVNNMYDSWKEQEKGKIMSQASEEAITRGISVFGQTTAGLGVSQMISAPMQAGRGKVQSDVQFWIDKTFSPITNELRFFGNKIESDWAPFFYRNRMGGAIGRGIGTVAGAIAGFYLPGGPLLWSVLFGSVGEMTGIFTQEGFTDPQAPPGGYSFGPVFGADPFVTFTPPADKPPDEIIYDRSGITINTREAIVRGGNEFAIAYHHWI